MKREIIWVVAILLVVVAAALFANTASVRLVLVVLAVLVLELYLRVKGLEKWVRGRPSNMRPPTRSTLRNSCANSARIIWAVCHN